MITSRKPSTLIRITAARYEVENKRKGKREEREKRGHGRG
jgi:hypothetical protein